MFPGVSATLFRQPGYQALDLTRGFASPPHDGFALIEKGSSLWAWTTAREVPDKKTPLDHILMRYRLHRSVKSGSL